MTRTVPKLSIVCPAFNEDEVLPRFHQELLRAADGIQDDYDVEIIYVDDGSRDRTLFLIRDWARKDSRVRYLSFSRNFGHQAALTAGTDHARGDIVVTMDTDLQHPPDLLPALLAKWREGYEIVVTIRADDPTLGWFKRHSSNWFYVFMRIFADMELRPAAADFRLMSRKAVAALGQLRESHQFLRGMVQWLGFPTAEVHFEPAQRAAGHSKFGLRRMCNFAVDGVVSFSRGPLRLPFYFGLGVLAMTLLFGGLGLVHGILGKDGPFDWGRFLSLVDLHVLGGLILCALGIVGEYIGRIFDQVRARPLYLLKESEVDLMAGTVRFPPSAIAQPAVRQTGTAA